jgi:hypothetical protein
MSGVVLRQPEPVPESDLPPDVQPLRRPAALGRATELAFLRWQKRRLKPTEAFWRDFGMHIVSSFPDPPGGAGGGAGTLHGRRHAGGARMASHTSTTPTPTGSPRISRRPTPRWSSAESGRGVMMRRPR